MNNYSEDTSKKSITHELELINQKKATLQRLVKLTANLNRLNQGLQSVLVLGQSKIQIPPKILKKYKVLSKKLEPLATKKLQHTLTATEIQIQNNIKRVLEITQSDESKLSEPMTQKGAQIIESVEQKFSYYVTDFQKKAQASIAIRVALKARRAVTSHFQLPVPETFIRNQITNLDTRETECRKKIKKELVSIYQNVTEVIGNTECPEEFKQQFLATRDNIVANLQHFNSGNSIENMPLIYESIELSSEESPVEESDNESLQPASAPVDEVLSCLDKELLIPLKRSLMSRVWEWLTTPMDHSWEISVLDL